MKKELKSGILSADKSADCRPTVGGVNVIAVLCPPKLKSITVFYMTFQPFSVKLYFHFSNRNCIAKLNLASFNNCF